MKKLSKRLWAALLAAVMVVGLMPVLTLQAEAEPVIPSNLYKASTVTAGDRTKQGKVPFFYVSPDADIQSVENGTELDVYYSPSTADSGLTVTLGNIIGSVKGQGWTIQKIKWDWSDGSSNITGITEVGSGGDLQPVLLTTDLTTTDDTVKVTLAEAALAGAPAKAVVTLLGVLDPPDPEGINLFNEVPPSEEFRFPINFYPVVRIEVAPEKYYSQNRGYIAFEKALNENREENKLYQLPMSSSGPTPGDKHVYFMGYRDHLICDDTDEVLYKPLAGADYKFNGLIFGIDGDILEFAMSDSGDLYWYKFNDDLVEDLVEDEELEADLPVILEKRTSGDFAGYYSILSEEDGFLGAADMDCIYTIAPIFSRVYSNKTGSNGSRTSTGTTTTTDTTTDTKTTDDITKQIDEGAKTVGIALGNGESEVSLTSDQLKDILDAGTGIAFTDETGTVTLTLSPEALAAAGIDGTKDVTFQVTPVDEATLPDAVKAVLDTMDEETRAWVVSKMFHISVSGQTEFSQPLLLTVDLSDLDLTQEQKDAFTGIRYNDDGSVDQLGGTWDKSGTKFSFYTSKTSTYGVLVSENLVKLNMAVGRSGYTLNGSAKTMDVAPMLIEDRTMVPLRFVAEALGAEVGWDAATKTVSVDLDGQSLKVTIGVRAPGMDVPATIVNDRTMVPIRYVAESLGCNVVWNADSSTIDIYR